MRYDATILVDLAKRCTSVAQMLRELGRPPYGRPHTYLSEVIRKHGIDTTHFKLGSEVAADRRKKHWRAHLVRGKKLKSTLLRRVMIEAGIEYRCSCGQDPVWRGRPLVLQIEHKNGDDTDNRRKNLEFLCPNCHTQTPTFAKTEHTRRNPPRLCAICRAKKLSKPNKSGLCARCWQARRKRSDSVNSQRCPDKPTLEQMIWAKPTTVLAAELGVSDKAVAKWCRRMGIAKPGPGYWAKRNGK